MSTRARRNHSAAFKAKVALAAIKGDRTIKRQQLLSAPRAGEQSRMPWHADANC